jgi:hypothetical protein
VGRAKRTSGKARGTATTAVLVNDLAERNNAELDNGPLPNELKAT